MDNEQTKTTTFLIFILIAIALAIYGMVCGRWLAKKSITLANDVNGDLYRGLKALALWPISIVALIIIPICVASLSDNFNISLDRRNVVLVISLVPSCIYNIYYRFKLVRENEKKKR
jgi:hypothetical protein